MTLALLALLPFVPPLQESAVADRVVDEAVSFLRSAGEEESRAVAALMKRWFPGRRELRDFSGSEGGIGRQGRELLRRVAAMLAEEAALEKRRGNGATAGMEAFRALQLHGGCGAAAELLGYLGGKPPREKELRERGLEPTPWGWFPEGTMREWRPGRAPENGRMVEERAADGAHDRWERAREMEFTFVRVRSDLPIGEAGTLGVRLDWFCEWLRSRFCLVRGYREPDWPIELRIYRRDSDYRREMRELLGERKGSDHGFTMLSRRAGGEIVMVNTETCAATVETVAGVAQHEASHAIFHQCFPGEAPREGTAYGWLTEAFPSLCTFVSPEHPIDGDLRRVVKGKFAEGDPRRIEVKRMLEGADVIGELNAIRSFDESKGHLHAYVAGACVSAYAATAEGVREKFAAMLAEWFATGQLEGGFEARLGPTAELSLAVARWLEERENE